MNSDEISITERLLNGYWANPAPSDDELAVWERSLVNCDFETACSVLTQIAESGEKWRPTAGEFVAAYRQTRARGPRSSIDVSEAPALPETTERLEEGETWPDRIRRQHGLLTGPLRHSFTGLTEGLPLDPRHPFPEHVHQRAMARAREMLEGETP